ncbi:MAG: 3-keto-5-aminohexanoate cleavage protein, partial [Silicimonas sp.]|nr:3-keto-5-aminohexanoate cleavage protein [Silicimonas sp.]
RRSKSDHPALPIQLDELVDTAVACKKAGAGGIHAHVRDENGEHSLDVGLYREAMSAIEQAAPDLFVQVTSEAADRFGPEEQVHMIRELRPASVSLALSELTRSPVDKATAGEFYTWARDAGIGIHHIVYTPAQLRVVLNFIDEGIIPGKAHQLQLVVGSYAGTEPSRPQDLEPYLDLINARKDDLALDWMVCAFGPAETACLAYAAARGGKVRVGFENSLWNADGSLAQDNAERVAEVRAAIDKTAQTLSPADR